MSSESTNAIGKSGESHACTLLESIGFKIVEKNWRHSHDEIDIIAENEEFIIFVEVKTRKNKNYGSPEVFVNKRKQSFMIRAADIYMTRKNSNKEARFDIVAVTGLGPRPEVIHIPNAFYPLMR